MAAVGRRVVYGALGGLIGAACMVPIRFTARRRGWIEKTVSQTAEEWLATRANVQLGHEPAAHHALDQALHLGYGAVLGVGHALLLDNRRRSSGHEQACGFAYGVGAWFLGSWGLLPALGAKRPPWRKDWRENAVDFVAHGLFGVVAALVSGEMRRQSSHLPTSDATRYLASTG